VRKILLGDEDSARKDFVRLFDYILVEMPFFNNEGMDDALKCFGMLDDLISTP